MQSASAWRPIEGGCHCGNLRLLLQWPADEAVIGARHCGCSFCRKHRGAWTSHAKATLRITIEDSAAVSHYRFGTETADFLVCRSCGVPIAVLSAIDDKLHAVVNVNVLDDLGAFSVVDSQTDFDGEDTRSRLRRRQKNWIASVSVD